MKLSDILYESKNGRKFVIAGKHGIGCYEVYENVGTHSERRAIIHLSSDPIKAFSRAKLEAEKGD